MQEMILFEDPNGILDDEWKRLLTRAARACVMEEGVQGNVCLSLLLTDDSGIRSINREQRALDAATDVLSFPTVLYPEGKTAGRAPGLIKREWSPEYRASYLGDIVISMDHAQTQAREFGHSLQRETCYLLIHGLCHLMGYDHMTEKEKQQMRGIEEKALNKVDMARFSAEELMEKAREAMQYSYSPYSHYRVGACLLAEDGTLYTGCNVENASYGLTNCAERTALFKAVSEGCTRFSAIAIAAEGMAPWPCGACRQVLSEFAPDIRVLVTWDGHSDSALLSELLPHGFSPAAGAQEHLGR